MILDSIAITFSTGCVASARICKKYFQNKRRVVVEALFRREMQLLVFEKGSGM